MYSDEELTALYPSDYYAYVEEIKGGLWKQRAKKWPGYWQGTREPHFDTPCIRSTVYGGHDRVDSSSGRERLIEEHSVELSKQKRDRSWNSAQPIWPGGDL